MTTLEDIIANLRGMSDLDAEIAKQAAPRLEMIAKRHARAGESPEGETWKPRKKDGGRAYANAEQQVSAEANGNVIALVLTGPEYYGQVAKKDASLPQRKIIPTAGDPLPRDLGDELAAVTAEVLARRSA